MHIINTCCNIELSSSVNSSVCTICKCLPGGLRAQRLELPQPRVNLARPYCQHAPFDRERRYRNEKKTRNMKFFTKFNVEYGNV